MRKIELEIVFEAPKYWSGRAFLGTKQDPQPYRVFADSLAELRELVQEGIDGGLGIDGIEFVEVFAHQDKGAINAL